MERQLGPMMDSSLVVQKSKAFTDSMFRRLFWPTLISTAGLAFGDIADALFVGIRIGKVGLATMSLVAPVYMIYNVLDVGIAIGASVKYTQALGRGDAKKGVEIFSQMLLVAIAVSLLVTVAGLAAMNPILRLLGAGPEGGELWNYTKEYLQIMFLGAPLTFLYFLLYYCVRCDDAEKLASAGFLIGYLTDIIGSAVFILGFKLDVRGAIYATVLGKAVGICVFMLHFTRRWAILRFRFVKPDWQAIYSALKTGMSSSFRYIGQFAALIVVNNILMRIGGESALAELNVVQDVSYVALAIYTALGDTVQPLCGTFYAEHNRDSIRRVMNIAVTIGVVSGGVIALLFGIFAPSVCRLFGLEGEAVAGGAFAVRMFCLSVIPAGLSLTWSACLQSIGREKIVFLINQLRTFVCFLLFALIFSYIDLKWFWLTFLAAELCAIAIWVPVCGTRIQPVSAKVFVYLLDTNSSDISDLLSRSEEFCEANGASPKQIYYVTLCVEEVCQAIVENAFRQNGDEYIQLTICFEEDGTVSLHIRDNAVNFNPFDMRTGHNYEDEEHLASLGIQMVKKKAKRFFYRRYAGFNTLTVEV
ncbi:MAG: ATP-binding protein [Oscillospiraceae bacterium]|nr:ATP-binding protein [Oscillospiraceae bacterium]